MLARVDRGFLPGRARVSTGWVNVGCLPGRARVSTGCIQLPSNCMDRREVRRL